MLKGAATSVSSCCSSCYATYCCCIWRICWSELSLFTYEALSNKRHVRNCWLNRYNYTSFALALIDCSCPLQAYCALQQTIFYLHSYSTCFPSVIKASLLTRFPHLPSQLCYVEIWDNVFGCIRWRLHLIRRFSFVYLVCARMRHKGDLPSHLQCRAAMQK